MYIINLGSEWMGGGVNTGRYIFCFYWLFKGFPPLKICFPIKTVGQNFLKPPSSKVERRCPWRNVRTSEGTWCSTRATAVDFAGWRMRQWPKGCNKNHGNKTTWWDVTVAHELVGIASSNSIDPVVFCQPVFSLFKLSLFWCFRNLAKSQAPGR